MSANTASKTLYLVDGSGFIFRAYHALPPLTRADGTPVGAVLGFCNIMLRLVQDKHADHIAVIFDAARKTFRDEIYKEYKANRPPAPEDLIPQFPIVREATRAFGIPAIEQDGYEADDLIATYAKQAVQKGFNVIIVSSDKDLMQLIGDGIRMQDPIKQTLIGPEQVVEKFGVPPEKVIEVQSLIGDAVDNVPGVPGIGVKTAAQLITEYGTLENLLENADKIPQTKRRETLIENKELALISKKLVTLNDNSPTPVPLDSLVPATFPSGELIAFLKAQGFKSILTRLSVPHESSSASDVIPAKAGISGNKAQDSRLRENDIVKINRDSYILLNIEKTLSDFVAQARAAGTFAIDTETTDLTPAKARLVGIALALPNGTAGYIPLGHVQGDLLGGTDDTPQLPLKKVQEILGPLLTDPAILKIGHNMKFDMQVLALAGLPITGFDDTMLLSYVLEGTGQGNGLDDLAKNLLGHDMIAFKDVVGTGKKQISFAEVDIKNALSYAAEDTDATMRIHQLLKPRLAQEKMVSVYEDIERPLIPVIAQMEAHGICVDVPLLKKLSQEFGTKLVSLEKDIHTIAGHEFNVASPKQLGAVLFEEMGIEGSVKTRTGEWSTAAEVLEDLAEQGHEIVNKVLEYRQLAKLKSTYTDTLLEQIAPATGRVHTSYNMVGTNTGRLSSSDPNLQNIPIKTEEGRRIREAFIAAPGHVLVSIDYSQVELRLVAEMAGITALQEAFRNNQDIHAITASQVFGVPLEEMTTDLRRQAKAINFGIVYGISGFGLARQLGIDAGTASQYIKQYFAKFPELAVYMENAKLEARKYGSVKTLYGRKCKIFGIEEKGPRRGAAERQAINAPIQGTAADVMKLAMIDIHHYLRDTNSKTKMLLQVHDELVFEVPENEVEETAAKLKAIMESVSKLKTPLTAEAGWGANWNAAH
ncbi:MAG: DNA polymerase I [Alphaproteobacteria bacterium]|nr:DNA polymerase I [Alphaproteobacteria bacterium]